MQTTRRDLETLMAKWEGRWRTRRLLLYLPRVLIGVLMVAIVGTLLLRASGLPLTVIAGVVGAGIAGGVIVIGGALRLFGHQGMSAARHFDQLFDLKARMTTALELMDGRITTRPDIAQRQLDDTLATAQNLDPRKMIKYNVRWLEVLPIIPLVIVLAVLLLWPQAGRDDAMLAPASQAAIADAQDDVRDLTEEIATDSTLTQDERDSLLESLEVSLDALDAPDTDSEEAFVNMSELESDLRQTAQDIQRDLGAQDQMLAEMSDALNSAGLGDLPLNSDASNAEALAQQLDALAQALENLTPAQREALSEALANVAQSADAPAPMPDLSQSLQDLGDALQNNDEQALQDALQQAQDELDQRQQMQDQRQQAAENLNSAADQAQQAADDIARAEQRDNQTSADAGDQQQQAQSGEEQAGQQGSEAQQQGAQGDEQSASQQQGDGQQSGQQGQQIGQSGQGTTQVQSQQSDAQSAQSGNSEDASASDDGGSGTGAGTGTGDKSDDIQAASDEITQNNADGRGGEREYQDVFAPTDIDGQGDSTIRLEADESDTPAQEGEFQANPDGESTVPYNEVFRTYADEANTALESDYIPLGMRDLVRDYFTSLEPDE